ncbi:MAG: hypothetical protein R2778_17785 [Saprospiraceae bacterium]
MSEITAQYEEGNSINVNLHDGSVIHLSKLAKDWDPQDRHSAMNRLYHAKASGEVLTGLIFIDTETRDLHSLLNTTETALNSLGKENLCPGSSVLEEINAALR